MLLRLCKLPVFEILAPELLAVNSSFSFTERLSVTGCDSKNKTKTTSPSNHPLEAAWNNNDILKYFGQETLF